MENRLKYVLLTIIFILGYTSLSFELIILRQIINFVGSNTLITSVIMAFVLGFLSLGYYIGSTISVAKHSIRQLCVKIVYVLSFWYVFACSYYIIGAIFYVLVKLGVMSALWQVFLISALLLIVPSMGLGFVTSSIGRIIHHFNSDYTGRFMAVDTIGSVAGSLLTTLFLMPLIGVFSASVCIVFLTMSIVFLISKRQKFILHLGYGILLVLLAFCILNEKFILDNKNLVLDNAISRVEIVDVDVKDNISQAKLMLINGNRSSKISKKEEFMFPYKNFIEKNYLSTLPEDKIYRILVLGAGGFTLGKDDARNKYVYVDVIGELQDIAEKYFLEEKLLPNKKFIFQDAYLYMLKTTDTFDVIVVDLYSSLTSIPENFVTEDFFKLVKSKLSPDGIMVANIMTSAAFRNRFSKRIDNTLKTVFSNSLSRQILGEFNPYQKEITNYNLNNVIYTYYNGNDDNGIYTIDKNSAVFGQ